MFSGELAERKKLIDDVLKRILSEKEPPELYEPMAHLINAGGKRLRPIMCLLACEAVGGKTEDVLYPAASLELIHNFTLVHDDIMDNDDFRRGVPTTHKKYGVPLAINAGDALFIKSIQVIAETKLPSEKKVKLLDAFSTAIFEVTVGQAMDISFAKKEATVDDYYKMIRKKTGVLLGASIEMGAICGDASEEEMKCLREYANNIGMAFQIQDDVIGIVGDRKKTGKPVGNDIRQGKKTIIILHALENSDKRKEIEKVLGNKSASEEQIKKIVDILDKCGSISYAKEKASELVARAKNDITPLKDSKAKKILLQLADFVIDRKF